MQAVFSFWSKPFTAYKGRMWATPLHHLLSWGLSLALAKRHFGRTVLITDRRGKALLVDRLGLEFSEVSDEMDAYDHLDPGWWAFSKLVAYSRQTGPFCHLDNDVFLWKPLPQALLRAPVFSQCPEHFHHAWEWGGPAHVERAFAEHGLDLPIEWEWARSMQPDRFREDNCGIVGGNDSAFFRHYSGLAIDLVTNPRNQAAWETFAEKEGFNMVVEQFMLAACVEYHRSNPHSPFRGVWANHLFPSFEQSYEEDRAARAGYTHLLGDAKSHPGIGKRLEERVEWEFPEFYRHCVRLNGSGAANA